MTDTPDDIVTRAHQALEGITEGPWEHRTAPHRDDDEMPVSAADKAEWQNGTLIGDGEPLHVLIAASPDPEFAYIVPALTGDGPTSERNAEFIAAARTLLPELVAEVKRLRPRRVETVEELDALPEHCIIRSQRNGHAYEKNRRYCQAGKPWWEAGNGSCMSSDDVPLPALLLWTPEAGGA
ncbi:hypothetical protein LV457_02765 [Mycobacterium sp. MYCO198283]|uniref:hypothetical protein n=1 Tax=Mycobacterium sp. MYCO198283 TaxID=2883505 RepID=UPI001E2BADCC|nr:hypothetical protein [Mycobacterium sp. MYCO198283]MCG5431212.1 hypothetical protein [Mycobacterium sp. MYCO198283]